VSLDVELDLSGDLMAVRDQGCRPTCLAFAVSDAHAYARGYPTVALSPEYAFFHAAQRMGALFSGQGVTAESILNALEVEGQPEEQHYPYISLLQASPLPAPPNPFPQPTYKRAVDRQSVELDHVIDSLRASQAVIVILDITLQFDRATGDPALVEVVPGDRIRGRHAVVAVGLARNGQNENYVKIRNSWGRKWGHEGYAWLSRPYLKQQIVTTARFR
jgi:hypothetical protein